MKVVINPTLREKLKLAANANFVPVTAMVNQVLKEYLNDPKTVADLKPPPQRRPGNDLRSAMRKASNIAKAVENKLRPAGDDDWFDAVGDLERLLKRDNFDWSSDDAIQWHRENPITNKEYEDWGWPKPLTEKQKAQRARDMLDNAIMEHKKLTWDDPQPAEDLEDDDSIEPAPPKPTTAETQERIKKLLGELDD